MLPKFLSTSSFQPTEKLLYLLQQNCKIHILIFAGQSQELLQAIKMRISASVVISIQPQKRPITSLLRVEQEVIKYKMELKEVRALSLIQSLITNSMAKEIIPLALCIKHLHF